MSSGGTGGVGVGGGSGGGTTSSGSGGGGSGGGDRGSGDAGIEVEEMSGRGGSGGVFTPLPMVRWLVEYLNVPADILNVNGGAVQVDPMLTPR
jgi:hypothetical protein